MKNLNTPLAIVIDSIILSNDPLAKCMDKVIENSYGDMTSKVYRAARLCSGNSN